MDEGWGRGRDVVQVRRTQRDPQDPDVTHRGPREAVDFGRLAQPSQPPSTPVLGQQFMMTSKNPKQPKPKQRRDSGWGQEGSRGCFIDFPLIAVIKNM